MFTGIIETTGIIQSVLVKGTNKTFRVSSTLSAALKVDQSLSHNGVCLTVEEVAYDSHLVTAIEETLKKTNLNSWLEGTIVNLERCMPMNGRIDGHIVQGHVDTTATCIKHLVLNGSWEYRFEFAEQFAGLIIEKGSISINGTSLTIFDVADNQFSVAIIPYTYHHTNFSQLTSGALVNLEFDMIGKYVNRIQSLSSRGI